MREVLHTIHRHAQANPTLPPAAIAGQELARLQNEEILICLPQRNAVSRMISYQQNKIRHRVPNNLRELIIDKTLAGKTFLIYDSDLHDSERILIFSTLRNIELLSWSNTIFSDGTYKTVPNQFVQLFTIHGLVRNFVFPLVFCLTVRQTEDT